MLGGVMQQMVEMQAMQLALSTTGCASQVSPVAHSIASALKATKHALGISPSGHGGALAASLPGADEMGYMALQKSPPCADAAGGTSGQKRTWVADFFCDEVSGDDCGRDDDDDDEDYVAGPSRTKDRIAASASDFANSKLTEQEKIQLSEDASHLSEGDMAHLLGMLQDEHLVPESANGEIELEMDKLPPQTLRRIQHFVDVKLGKLMPGLTDVLSVDAMRRPASGGKSARKGKSANTLASSSTSSSSSTIARSKGRKIKSKRERAPIMSAAQQTRLLERAAAVAAERNNPTSSSSSSAVQGALAIDRTDYDEPPPPPPF